MRISFYTIFQVAALIVKDVLAFEAEQSNQPLPSAPATATDATTPVDTQPVVNP
ncbi:MAG: hypothetical protein V7L23_12405 [Nostoc sp.]|uniref:hypothetical protein n=1 Tax=Nostoc sp. TaxID=1180 RepID=UPI002FEEAEF7